MDCLIELVAKKVQGYVHVSLFRSERTKNQYSVFLHVLFYVFSVHLMHGLTLVYIYIYIYIYDHGLFVSVIAKCLGRVTMQKLWYFWKRIMILAEEYGLGRG